MSSAILDAVVTEYLKSVEAGGSADPEPWITKYPELAAELRAFFAQHAKLQGLAEKLAQDVTVAPEAGREVPTLRYVGDYELLSEIARGGMGVVFRACQKTLAREVAVKMMLSGALAGEADLARFRTEAEAAAGLDHPNILPLYEVGEHEGLPYFSMKLVSGGSLADVMAELKADPKRAARLMAMVARAVHHAHQRGVLHRDLKPANILLDRGTGGPPVPREDTPYVSDFGLARRGSDKGLTQTGQVLGTPSYMAPEQARAEKALTVAVDVYALGAMLYECLTGKPPFRAESVFDTLMQVIEKEPPHPRTLEAKADADLSVIALKCLSKEPVRRYGSAAELADDLERWLRGDPILARPVGGLERGVRWCWRNPLVAGLTAAVFLALMIGLAASLWQMDRANREAIRADQEARTATDNLTTAQAEKERADAEANRAADGERTALRNLYVSQMGHAHLAWKDGQVGRVLDLLKAQIPSKQGDEDFRGFEWHYLHRLCSSGHSILVQQSQPFSGMACSPDGQIIATASRRGRHDQRNPELKLWDAATGVELRTLPGFAVTNRALQTDTVSITFSPSGKHVAALAWGDARIWEVKSGKLLHTFKGYESTYGGGIAFDAAGNSFASATGQSVRVWGVGTGKAQTSPKPHDANLTCLAISPSSDWLIAGSASNPLTVFGPSTVVAWDVKTGNRMLAFNHPGGVTAVAVSPDCKFIASAGYDFTIRLWDVETKREKVVLRGHTHTVPSLVFVDGNRKLLSGSLDGTVRVWDVATGTQERMLRGHTVGVTGLAVPEGGRRVWSCGWDGTVRDWDWRADQEYRTLKKTGFVLAFHPDGRHLAAGGLGVNLLEMDTGKIARSYKNLVINVPATAITLNRDGTRLAFASGAVHVWDTVAGKKVFGADPTPFLVDFADPEGSGIVFCLAFSPDGAQLASSGRGFVRIRNAATGKILLQREVNGWAKCVAYSPDGKHLAVSDGTHVALWDTTTWEVYRTYATFKDVVLHVLFTADGQRLIAVSDTQVRSWECRSGKECVQFAVGNSQSLMGSESEFWPRARVALTADGHRLAMANLGNGTVGVWDIAIGQQVLSLSTSGQQVMAVAFSPDGHRLAATGNDGTVHIWDARPLEKNTK